VALDLIRRVHGSDLAGAVDIRNQQKVGADAVDELRNFCKPKTHAGPISNTVSLQGLQVQRTIKAGEKFFLVFAGNLEAGGAPPEVRIVTDPLRNLTWHESAHITVSGVREARSGVQQSGVRRPE
jgi:hypothetical protein